MAVKRISILITLLAGYITAQCIPSGVCSGLDPTCDETALALFLAVENALADQNSNSIITCVAAGYNGTIWKSTDSINWVDVSPGGANIFSVVYANGTFVTSGASGQAAYSTDAGETWTDSTFDTALYKGLTFGENLFVSAGDNGRIRHSSDGSTWTAANPGGVLFHEIGYGNGRFVAVENSGGLKYSNDPTNSASWTSVATGANHLYGITYGDGRFVAAANGGEIWYSTDASTGTWTDATPAGNPTAFYSVEYTGGLFVATATNHGIWTSPTGLTGSWTEANTGAIGNLRSTAFGNGAYMVVGDGGEIWRSEDASPGSFTNIGPGGDDLRSIACDDG